MKSSSPRKATRKSEGKSATIRKGTPGNSSNTGDAGICKVAILGFGTVGSSVARILSEQKHAPLRLTHICNRNVTSKRVDWLPGNIQWTEDINDVLQSDVDVVVEVMGGLKPAEDWIRRALSAGKSVVTANKQLIARSGPE